MRTHRIRAAVLRGSWQPLSIESLEMEGPRADEVLVRIVASGVCHTDISFCEFWEAEDPVVLGHEGAGIVEETGEAVKGLKPGDHVVLLISPVVIAAPAGPGIQPIAIFFMSSISAFSASTGATRFIAAGFAVTFSASPRSQPTPSRPSATWSGFRKI